MNSNVTTYKIVIAGNAAVGKSSIILRLTNDRFDDYYLTTIGVDFKFKEFKVNNQNYKLQIWDTAGQDRFKSVSQSFYRGAHAIILVFDLTCDVSLSELQNIWYNEALNKINEKTTFMILGNKSDSTTSHINTTEIKKFCDSKGYLYFETSAKTGSNIELSFLELTKRLTTINFDADIGKSTVLISNAEDASGKDEGCCN